MNIMNESIKIDFRDESVIKTYFDNDNDVIIKRIKYHCNKENYLMYGFTNPTGFTYYHYSDGIGRFAYSYLPNNNITILAKYDMNGVPKLMCYWKLDSDTIDKIYIIRNGEFIGTQFYYENNTIESKLIVYDNNKYKQIKYDELGNVTNVTYHIDNEDETIIDRPEHEIIEFETVNIDTIVTINIVNNDILEIDFEENNV